MDEVCPCIFEGSLSELLQQAEWMNGLLNQLVDWLEKAASNSLLNFEQGWEPMRIDNPAGNIGYSQYTVLNFLKDSSFGYKEVYYQTDNNYLWVGFPADEKRAQKAILCIFKTQTSIEKYIPNKIKTLSSLYSYAKSIGIGNFKDSIEELDKDYNDHDLLF